MGRMKLFTAEEARLRKNAYEKRKTSYRKHKSLCIRCARPVVYKVTKWINVNGLVIQEYSKKLAFCFEHRRNP